MRETPPGWPRISTAIYYQDAARAIDWLCEAFGFEVRIKIVGEGGAIEHSELTYGEGLIMVAAERSPGKPGAEHWRSPRSLGGDNTQSMMVYVDDVEGHCARARAAGATIESEPETHDYGDAYWADRTYACVDLEGHRWWFSQRIRSAAI